jgi:hypothetical protein
MIAFINSPFQAFVLHCYLCSINYDLEIHIVIREYNNFKELSDTNVIKRCLSQHNSKYIIVRNGISRLKIMLIMWHILRKKYIIIGDMLNKFNVFFLKYKPKEHKTLLLEDGTSFHVDNEEINLEIHKYSVNSCFCISGLPDKKYGNFKIKLGKIYPLPLLQKTDNIYRTKDKFIILGSPAIEHNVCSAADYDSDLKSLIEHIEKLGSKGKIVYFRHRRESKERLQKTLSKISKKRECDIRKSLNGFDVDILSAPKNNYLNNKIIVSFPSTAILILAQNNLLFGCENIYLKKSKFITNSYHQQRSDRIFNLCKKILTTKRINHVVL